MDQAEIPICEEPSRVDVTVREHVIESGSEPKIPARNSSSRPDVGPAPADVDRPLA
jgi:hypothetical protein